MTLMAMVLTAVIDFRRMSRAGACGRRLASDAAIQFWLACGCR